MKTAADLMNARVITARPDMTCDELQELLVANRISGVPVVDDGVLIGVISMADVLNSGLNQMYTDNYFEASRVDQLLAEEGFHVEWPSEGYVSDFMSRDVVTATPDAPVTELARLMHDRRIHRVIVTDSATSGVVGIVTTFDLLKWVMAQTDSACKPCCGKPQAVGVV